MATEEAIVQDVDNSQPVTVEDTTTPDSQPEETNGQAETEKQKGEVPFHENPEFNKRVEERVQKKVSELETTYKIQAGNWSAIEEIARTDPEYAVLTIRKLEEAGKLQPGTADKAAEQLGVTKKEEKARQEEADSGVLPQEEFRKAIEDHPDIKFARRQREQAEMQEWEKAKQTEEFISKFEERHPDIAKAQDAEMLRQRIGIEAKALQSQGHSQEEAMELAYKWVVDRESVLEEYKKSGKIEGIVRSSIEDSTTASLGGSTAQTTSVRSLSTEEDAARKMLGVSAEEYVKLLDDPSSGKIE